MPEYVVCCPNCDVDNKEERNIETEFGTWCDIMLDIKCHCKKCDAYWVEHFVFDKGSYEGYTFDGTEYDEDGKEIERYE